MKGEKMSISRQEEVIAILWAIASLLAFIAGQGVWGYIFATKAAMDMVCAIYHGIKEVTVESKVT